MRIIENERGKFIQLESGEPIPVYCSCRHIYQPELNSEWSQCPKCFKDNIHYVKIGWKLVKEY